jgi:hypothetical protein
MRFRQDQELTDLAKTKNEEQLHEHANSSCTTGYDNDGSTGFEIFENGFSLGQLAGDKSVYVIHIDNIAYFFVGTYEGVEAELKNLDDDPDLEHRT